MALSSGASLHSRVAFAATVKHLEWGRAALLQGKEWIKLLGKKQPAKIWRVLHEEFYNKKVVVLFNALRLLRFCYSEE
ncbi:MAG: hypothetical protein ACK5L3_09085 [Oscillospiraceae bacterium]